MKKVYLVLFIASNLIGSLQLFSQENNKTVTIGEEQFKYQVVESTTSKSTSRGDSLFTATTFACFDEKPGKNLYGLKKTIEGEDQANLKQITIQPKESIPSDAKEATFTSVEADNHDYFNCIEIGYYHYESLRSCPTGHHTDAYIVNYLYN